MNRINPKWHSIFFEIAALWMWFQGAAPAVAVAAEKDQIWQTFADRQAAAETASLSWRQSTLASPSRNGLSIEQASDSTKADSSPVNKKQAHPVLLILAGDRVRYESSIRAFAGGRDGDLVPSVVAYDGKRNQSLTNEEFGGMKDMDAFDEWSNIALFGAVLNLRPLRPEFFGESPAKWTVEDSPSVIDGRRCVVLSHRRPRGFVTHVHLDPEKNYVPLRYASLRGDRPSARVDMHYERTEEPTWIPSSWTSTFYAGGRPSHVYRIEVQEVVLGLEVPDETFTIEYPPGAELTVVEGPIHTPESEKRVVVAQTGELVPHRLAVAEATKDSGWGWWYLVLVALGVAVLGGALWLWRREASVI